MRNKKRNKLFLLMLLILGISVGFALLTSNLNITGIGGINKNTWDIHWKSGSVAVSSGSVAGDTPTISGDNNNTVTFSATLELPGDYFEFTVDAENSGTVDGMLDEIVTTITDGDSTSETYGQEVALEDYINYTVTYADGSPLKKNQKLGAGQTEKIKVRIEFDSDAEEVPEEDITYKIETEIPYDQPDPDKIMPVRYAEFDTGSNVATKIRGLAGDDISGNHPESTVDNNITSFERSNIAPDLNSMTDANIISSENSKVPIYAWFDNGAIKYYCEDEDVYLNEDASVMFNNLKSITSIDTSYKTKNTKNMSAMFAGTVIETLDLRNFNTSNVTNMEAMFSSSKIQALDLSSFNTKNVTSMAGMFASCTDIEYLNLSSFDVSKVSAFVGGMFNGCSAKTIDISNWNFASITSLSGMFSGCQNLENINLSNVNTSNITNINYMFGGCTKLQSLDMSSFDTSHVTNFYVFGGNTELKSVNISGWDFSSATSTSEMFKNLANLETVIMNNVNTSTITNMSGMFKGCSSLKSINVSSLNTSNVTNMSDMFNGCSTLTKLDISNFDTSKLTSFAGIVGGCTNLEELNMSNFNFSSYNQTALFMSTASGGFSKLKKLTLDNAKLPNSMNYGLGGLGSVEEISLKSINTSNVTDMVAMFYGDNHLLNLNLDSFDTSNVTAMSSMFYNCSSLTTISVSNNFVVDNVAESDNMFKNCNSLVGGNGTVFDSNHINKEYAHYDFGVYKPGYFNAKDTGINTFTVTFDPNGGQVDEETRTVVEGTKISTLPTATKTGETFTGWYTEDGAKVSEKSIIVDDITLYAHWYSDTTITYNANTGTFGNDTTIRNITYEYTDKTYTKYSHTPNINDNGSASKVYDDYLDKNDIVTIKGAPQLNIEVWFTTQEASYDWLAIYPAGVTPSSSNYSQASISNGKLAGHGSYTGYTKPNDNDTTYHRTFTATGDTAQFYFKSNYSDGYYGYYAIITGISKGYVGDQQYLEPSKENNRFIGWNTKRDGTGKTYKNAKEIEESIDGENNNMELYAMWQETTTITFDANGGNLQWTSQMTFDKGDRLGFLPSAVRTGYGFDGWYTDEFAGIKVDVDYIVNTNQTLWARWSEIEAEFDAGKNVNVKLKALAGDDVSGNNPWYTADTNVTAIRRATTAPDTSTMTNDNIISSANSSVPIYAWFDNGTIYWWSSANREYTNEDASYMFYNFASATSIDTSFSTTQTINMSYMFEQCRSLTSIDVSDFDVSHVTNMYCMLYYTESLQKLDISTWNLSSKPNMDNLIGNSSIKELDMSNLDISYCPGAKFMLNYIATGSDHIERIKLDNAKLPSSMSQAFIDLEYLEEISFKNADFSKVERMYGMLQYCYSLTKVDFTGINTKNVTNMAYLFWHCRSLETVDLSPLNTSSVTDLSYMFQGCEKLKSIDLSTFDTHNVINWKFIIEDCKKLKTINFSNLDFSSYTSSDGFAYNITGGSLNDEEVDILILDNAILPSGMYNGFVGFHGLKELSLKNVDTSRVTTFQYMFQDMDGLTILDISSFDTTNVTNAEGMFSNMDNIKTIYVSNSFDLTNAGGDFLFSGDTKLVGENGTVYDSNHTGRDYARIDREYEKGYFTHKTPIVNNTLGINIVNTARRIFIIKD